MSTARNRLYVEEMETVESPYIKRRNMENKRKEEIALEKRARRLQRKKANSRKLVKVKLFLGIILVASVVTVTMLREMSIAKVKYDISAIDKAIEQNIVQRDDMRIELESVKNSEWIQSEAKEKINMRVATKDKINYINMGKIEMEQNNNQIAMLFSKLFK